MGLSGKGASLPKAIMGELFTFILSPYVFPPLIDSGELP
jgi:hypothetical protein